MAQERSKDHHFSALQVVFISKLISKKLLIKNHILDFNLLELYSYFIDHSTHKTTWQDPRVNRPEAIPMSQFKVKQ